MFFVFCGQKIISTPRILQNAPLFYALPTKSQEIFSNSLFLFVKNKESLDGFEEIYSNASKNHIKRIGHVHEGKNEPEEGHKNKKGICAAGTKPALRPLDLPNEVFDGTAVNDEQDAKDAPCEPKKNSHDG